MKKLLPIVSILELATGLAFLVTPALVGELLLGVELTGMALPVARVFGIALIALAVACLAAAPLIGMLTYSAVVALYLAYLGCAGEASGILLWPAVILHAILTILLARAVISRWAT